MHQSNQMILGTALILNACAPARAVTTHDASVQEHERAAERDDELAELHEDDAKDAAPCADAPGVYEICWTRSDTATAHEDVATRHRQWAAAHRAAAAELQAAAAEACKDIEEADRDTSPFERTADIAAVELLDGMTTEGAALVPIVRITFRKVERLDVARLQQVIDCHIARNAVLGHDLPHMPACPLVPRGVQASASQEAGRTSVTIMAPQSALADITDRSRALQLRTGGAR